MNSQQYVTLYGHFYQPPREDPFTGRVPREPGATPYENFNEKITAECYKPNAEAGNFEHISFDLGPTLAAWLERYQPQVYQRIVDSDRKHLARFGVGNALAQAYNHTILPLANARDKRTQVLWGLQDFEHRFSHQADGMWLAETAVDLETLAIVAEAGIRYTVLAPWQAAEGVDVTEPYRVALPGGRSITVFFYNGPLSGGVSFDSGMTSNADTFAASFLPHHLNERKVAQQRDQLIVIATDGELYGHHKPWRDRFLSHLLHVGAESVGFQPVTLGVYLREHPAVRETTLRVPSAWSCAHGVARWSTGCECTEGDSAWKPALRHAFDRLAAHIDEAFLRGTKGTLTKPWVARDAYLPVQHGWMSQSAFWRKYGKRGFWPRRETQTRQTMQLLEAEYYGQWMYTSCGFFFEDLDRIEPRNDIAFARRAISLVWQATRQDLQSEFVADLAEAHSWRSGLSGADLYAQLPPVAPELLPPSAQTEPAA